MFWGKNEWLNCPDSVFPISPRINTRIDEAGYRLAVGHEVYLAEGNGANAKPLNKNESFHIKPGQFAFILTEEVVTLPGNLIAFISVRAGTKFYGLVNVSGFHVDPGYTGKLIFAVFNAGPTRINLRRGQDIFSIWVAELKSAIKPEDYPEKSYYIIDSEIVNKLDGQHLTAYQVDEKLDAVRKLSEKNEANLRNFRVYVILFIALVTLILAPIARPMIEGWWSGAINEIKSEELD